METTTPEVQKVRTAPSDFFLHLGIIVALFISSISLVNLLFAIINKAFPDRLNMYYDGSADTMRWATASLLIMFPLYIILGWLYKRQLDAVPEKRYIGIRRWLVYFTLFIAGLALAIDLITLVYYFMGGEITTRFVLKVLSVLVVAGLIFSYYLYDVRKGSDTRSNIFRGFVGVAILLVLGSIIAGFAVIGSPMRQRQARFDQQRVYDLQSIQYQVINYWQQKGKLPEKLTDINDPLANFVVPVDPETDGAYEYKKNSDLAFNLCATFNLPSTDQQNNSMVAPGYPGGAENNTWKHGEGNQCFTRTIDPELYPTRDALPLKPF